MKIIHKKIKFWYGLTLSVTVLWSIVSVLVPITSGEFINQFLANTQNIFGGYFWLFVVSSLFQILLSTLSTFLSLDLVKRIKNFFRQTVIAKLFTQRHYQDEALSAAITDINVNSQVVAEQYVKGEIDIINCLVMIVASAVGLLTINLALSAVIIVISLLIVLFPKVLAQKSQANREQQAESQDQLNKRLTAFIKGIETLANFRAQKYYPQMLGRDNQNIFQTEGRGNNFRTITYGVNAFLQVVKTLIIIGFGAYLISLQRLTMGGLLAAIQIAATLGAPMEVLSMLLYYRREVTPIAQRINAYAKDAATTPMPVSAARIKQIELEHYMYTFAQQPILKDLSLTFERGKKYLLVGKSGSGKSTLLRGIAGTGAGAASGVLKINGLTNHFFQQMKLVTQTPAVFPASLEDNLWMGQKGQPEKMQEVLNLLELNHVAERFGTSEYLIADNLSGGEKQRIALGRALLANPDVLLLDEFSAALDPQLSIKLEKYLLRSSAMVISVTHHVQKELLPLYDEVIELDAGEVVSVSTPQSLK